MKSTMYLTGKPASTYSAVLKPLASQRISDMLELKNKLKSEARQYSIMDKEFDVIYERFKEVQTAIEWWHDLMYEMYEEDEPKIKETK